LPFREPSCKREEFVSNEVEKEKGEGFGGPPGIWERGQKEGRVTKTGGE